MTICRVTLIAGMVLLTSIAVHAQTDPSMPPAGSPIASANSQTTPGVARSSAGGLEPSSTASMGADAGLMKDKIFLRRATMGGLAEIEFAQIAMQKGSSDDVKKLAAKLVKDHTALNALLKPFAESLGISLPTAVNRMDRAEEEKLNGLSGVDFDKEFLAYTAQDHHRDLKTFKAEADSTTDADLKEAVVNGQAMIAAHSRVVDKLAAANGVPVDTVTKP